MPIRQKVLPVSQPKDPVPSSSDSTWEFVNISQRDRGNNAELRRSIRANAMRHYHSEQRARKRKLEHHGDLCKKPTSLEKSKRVSKESDGSLATAHGGCQSLRPLAVCATQDATSRYDGESNWKTLVYPCSVSALEHPTPPNSPYTRLGNGDSDPFNSLPVQDSPLDSRIFHHCKSSILLSVAMKPLAMISLGYLADSCSSRQLYGR